MGKDRGNYSPNGSLNGSLNESKCPKLKGSSVPKKFLKISAAEEKWKVKPGPPKGERESTCVYS